MILQNFGKVTLEEAGNGRYIVAEIDTEVKYIKDRLKMIGIYEGAYIEKEWTQEGTGVFIIINRETKLIGMGVAKQIMVKDYNNPFARDIE